MQNIDNKNSHIFYLLRYGWAKWAVLWKRARWGKDNKIQNTKEMTWVCWNAWVLLLNSVHSTCIWVLLVVASPHCLWCLAIYNKMKIHIENWWGCSCSHLIIKATKCDSNSSEVEQACIVMSFKNIKTVDAIRTLTNVLDLDTAHNVLIILWPWSNTSNVLELKDTHIIPCYLDCSRLLYCAGSW